MPWTPSNRALAFWLLCLPARLALAVAAATAAAGSPLAMATAAALLGIGLSQVYLYATGGRMQAPEGGGETWWARYRLLHGALLLGGAAATLRGTEDAWRALPLADPAAGALLWLAVR